MTLRLSTVLRDRLMGEYVTKTATTISAVITTDVYADSGNGLLSAGFLPGMVIKVSGFTNDENNVWSTIASVESDGSEMSVTVAAADALATEAAGNSVTIAAEPQSFMDIFRYGVMKIYTGSQPADADDAPTGTCLLIISVASGAVTKGTSTNGLEFDAPVDGVLGKADADTWSDAGLQTGTAGWFRFYTNEIDEGGNGCNFDGAVGTSGAELNLSSTSIVSGATTTIDEFEVTLPAS